MVLLGFPQQGKLEKFLLNDKFTVFSQMMDLQFGSENRLLIPLTVCLSVMCRRKGHGSAVVISLPLIYFEVQGLQIVCITIILLVYQSDNIFNISMTLLLF